MSLNPFKVFKNDLLDTTITLITINY
jgi:hypothetical protein